MQTLSVGLSTYKLVMLVMHRQSSPDFWHARHCLPTALSPSFRSSDTSLWIASKTSRLAIYWKRKGEDEVEVLVAHIVIVQSDVVPIFSLLVLCSYYTRAALISLILIARRHQQWLDKVRASNTVMTDAVSSTQSWCQPQKGVVQH